MCSSLLLFNNHPTSANVNIAVGESFIYNIEQASGYSRYISDISGTNLYRVNNVSVDVGSELNITVSDITFSCVDYFAFENTTFQTDYSIYTGICNFNSHFDNIFPLVTLEFVKAGIEVTWENGINFADGIYFIPDEVNL